MIFSEAVEKSHEKQNYVIHLKSQIPKHSININVALLFNHMICQ